MVLVFLWLYFGSNNLVWEKYQMEFREYEHKTTQMCTEKYLDYLIRTRVWITDIIPRHPPLSSQGQSREV